MFPITKATLSFREISDYWSREMRPSASPKELLGLLESAWWLDEIRGSSVLSRLQLLKKMFASMRDQDHVGIVFVVGNDEDSLPVQLEDGSVKVDVRPRIPIPSGNPESWDEVACINAFQALAETCSIDQYPILATHFGWIELTYDEFIAWLAKRGYPEPQFWRPGLKKHTYQKRWKPKAGDKNKLTDHEKSVMSAVNELFRDGNLEHKAKRRDTLINEHLTKLNRSKVSPRVIQRALRKIEFV